MKVLVTGNLGFIGAHLTKILLDGGHEVVGCDLNLFPDSVALPLTEASFQLIQDFRTLTEEQLAGVNAVVHLAALSNDPLGALRPGITMAINGQGSVELAIKAKRAGVKIFIFSSSCSVYGASGDLPKLESDSVEPLSEYAESKLFAETELKNLNSTDFKTYLLRNATSYGFSFSFRRDLAPNDFSCSMEARHLVELRSDGNSWRPFIQAIDIAIVMRRFLEKNPEKYSGLPINVGFSENNFQIRDVALAVKQEWGLGTIQYASGVTIDPRNYKVDFSLLKNIFPDLTPIRTFSESLSDLHQFLIGISYSKMDYKRSRYVRFAELFDHIDGLKI